MKKGMLDPGTYVMIFVFFIFVCATTLFMWPIIQNIIGTETSYATGNEKYLFFLIPGVLVIGALVMFFFPSSFNGGGR